jgi:LDH2 family malate/lactate/ureidoglycolate dehydrogenase
VYLAKNRGEPIPETWALTADGAPTTDPAEGVLGVILPMAGHKGYAIAFLMDVLSGALTGSSVGTGVHGPYEADARSGAGHLFLALDPAAFGDEAGYAARVGQLIDEVKAVPLAQGFDEVFHPGEVEDRAEAATLDAGGIALAEGSLADLRRLAAETGVPFPEGTPA